MIKQHIKSARVRTHLEIINAPYDEKAEKLKVITKDYKGNAANGVEYYKPYLTYKEQLENIESLTAEIRKLDNKIKKAEHRLNPDSKKPAFVIGKKAEVAPLTDPEKAALRDDIVKYRRSIEEKTATLKSLNVAKDTLYTSDEKVKNLAMLRQINKMKYRIKDEAALTLAFILNKVLHDLLKTACDTLPKVKVPKSKEKEKDEKKDKTVSKLEEKHFTSVAMRSHDYFPLLGFTHAFRSVEDLAKLSPEERKKEKLRLKKERDEEATIRKWKKEQIQACEEKKMQIPDNLIIENDTTSFKTMIRDIFDDIKKANPKTLENKMISKKLVEMLSNGLIELIHALAFNMQKTMDYNNVRTITEDLVELEIVHVLNTKCVRLGKSADLTMEGIRNYINGHLPEYKHQLETESKLRASKREANKKEKERVMKLEQEKAAESGKSVPATTALDSIVNGM